MTILQWQMVAITVPPLARSRMLLTDFARHRPPRAVATPRAFNAAAMSLNDVAPAFCASRMMGRTLKLVCLRCHGIHRALAGHVELRGRFENQKFSFS
jgi:hypothetical protein